MRKAIFLLVTAGLLSFAGVSSSSCSGGGGGGGTGGGSGTGGGTATGGGTSGAGGGTVEMADADAGVCGTSQGNCTLFEDRTAADAGRTVEFAGSSGVAAEPACMRIKKGQTVTVHNGIGHPLQQLCGPVNRKYVANEGATTNITFNVAGKYGGDCVNHGFPSVIQVDP